MFKSLGTGRAGGRIQLSPEEALYMVERGNLDLKVAQGDSTEAWSGIPLSLQHCYALLLGQEGLTAERYTVYTGLKRLGMAIHRASEWDQRTEPKTLVAKLPSREVEPTPSASRFLDWLYGLLWKEKSHTTPPLGPLVGVGIYRSFGLLNHCILNMAKANRLQADIYRSLHQIPYYNAAQPLLQEGIPSSPESENAKPICASLRPSFNVWKPAPDFKKSTPGEPDFRIVVVNARESNFPTLDQLDELFMDAPADPPPPRMKNQLNQKLKHGSRNIILAVVDQGVTSYLRMAEGNFGAEKLYEREGVGKPGFKRNNRKKRK